MATLIVDDDLHERLQCFAEAHDMSPQLALREAVEQMLGREQNEVEVDPGLLAEAEASLAAFRHDGLHLTGDEVRQWLRNSKGNEPLPACHA